jgi:hypothetical protein
MALLLMGALLLAFGVIIKLVPTKDSRRDDRVDAFNRTLNPLLTAMIVAGAVLLAAGLVNLAL